MAKTGLRILVVDDNREWLEMLTEALCAEGYVVRSAASGTQALSLLENFTPEVVVTDLRMPLIDGESLIAKLHVRRPSLPIVVVTGETGKAGSVELEAAFDVIEKPASLDRILASVGAAVASGSSLAASAHG
jgi:two-component system, NtrC family, response regulator HydG